MIEFILASDNLPFSAAIGLMVAIGVLEGLGMILGLGLSAVLDHLIPSPDVNLNVDLDASVLTKLLGWLNFGRVPLLVLLIIFLTAFGLIGFMLQGTVFRLTGMLLPAALSTIPAVLLTLPIVRVIGKKLSKVMPQDESMAVSQKSFIGRVARVSKGVARRGLAAEARLQDQHGHFHYVLVEPDLEHVTFAAGSHVLLVRREGISFRVIEPPPSIINQEQVRND